MGAVVYKQVKMGKDRTVQTAWVPSKFARKGKVIRIKEDDKWNDGWHVIEVYAPVLDEHVALEQAHGYKCFPSIDFDHKN